MSDDYAAYANHCAIKKEVPMTWHTWKRGQAALATAPVEQPAGAQVTGEWEAARQWILTQEHPPASDLYALLVAYARYAALRASETRDEKGSG